MTSTDTARDGDDREGQDHEAEEIPSVGEIRFHRAMRLVCGLAVWPVAAIGIVRIAESGIDPMEIVTTVVAVATVVLFCAYAGARANELQTARDEATASPATE
jgi:hypothetical protein